MPPEQASQGNGQSQKRKNGAQENNSSNSNPRAAKRSRVYEARTIPVQRLGSPAGRDGELDVQSFVNSMAFEINALDESIRRSRTFGTSRAFQRVPFTMRRRTAAHNYKRVPKRLHNCARKEMAEDNTPTVNSRTKKPKTSRARIRAETAWRLGILAKRKRLLKLKKGLGTDSDAIATRAARPKIRRNELNELPVTAPRFRKRQRNKVWLPTHLWHVKRARMTEPSNPLWGFSIPTTPTQKNYRPTHRVQWHKGAMAWDMSYMSTIGIFGKENIVQNILKDIGLTQESLWAERGGRWRAGVVHWSGNLSRKVKNATQPIGPATIIWNPSEATESSEADKPPRQLLIRIHPSAFSETFNELLRLVKAYKPRPYIQDLRHEIGSIDVTGPDATEALLGVLKPYDSSSKDWHASSFEGLVGLRDPASLLLGALLAFSIVDPRLKYPPRKVPPPDPETDYLSQRRLLESIAVFRKERASSPYQLFDRDVRFKASKLPSQRSLNRRRGKTGPGTPLEPSSADPPIPIMLLASRNGDESWIPGSWTLLLPWKCVLPVWYSLMHYPLSTGGNPAFGGLDEIRQLAFERGQPWFPGDMPGTDAGNAWETREREARRKVWDGKPRGKRVNWETLDLGAGRKGEVGVGWSCDFETLFSLPQPGTESTPTLAPPGNAPSSADGGEDHEMSEVTEPDKETELASKETEPTPEQTSPIPKTTKTEEKKAQPPLTDITYLPKSIFTSLTATRPVFLPRNATITVRIKLVGRGVVTTCARVYRLPDAAPSIPKPTDPATEAEVPATQQHLPPTPQTRALPPNLREQWLAQQPTKHSKSGLKNDKDAPTTESRIQSLAQTLTAPPPNSTACLAPGAGTESGLGIFASLSSSTPPATAQDINGHPLCPDAKDLIGFVTAGSFNLRDGRGEAIASISALMAAEELGRYDHHHQNENGKGKGKGKKKGGTAHQQHPAARLCVVREAGQAIGWLARWEIV